MNNFKKLSQRIKKVATTTLSICALTCTMAGTAVLIGSAEGSTESTAYTKVAHYEFHDASNLGKDSLGKNHLINAGGVAVDTVNGGVTLGKENGFLYAADLGEEKDFSDSIDGSFSISTRLYICDAWQGGNYLISTGSYGSNFLAEWTYWGINTYLGNDQSARFGTQESPIFVGSTFYWYRISWIYDEDASSFRTVVLKESTEETVYDTTNTLTSAIDFGGHEYSLTVGAQSKFGQNVDGLCDSVIGHDDLMGYPGMSDLRVYQGAIDDTELAAIEAYDKNNLENPPEIIDPSEKEDFTSVAHYEFNDASNLGKDSLGKNHLVNAGGVVADEVNGGAIFGDENGGYLYASPDFSDNMEGSYSLSLRAYLRSGSGGVHFLASTGYVQDGTAFSIYQSYGSILMYYGNTGNAQSHSFALGLKSTKAWYRITMIYNEDDLSFRLMATKEGDASYSFDETATLSAATTFGGSTSGVFTIGARSTGTAGKFTNLASDTPTITDFRIYDGVIGTNELAAIEAYDKLNAEKKAVADNSEVVGAAIRMVGEPGLRFLAKINESIVNEYVTKYGAENVSFGVKLIRNHNSALAYAYVPAVNKTLDGGIYSFNAVVTGMTEEYYATEYTAQVYIAYTVDGETTYVISDSSAESKTRSIASVAEAVLEDTYVVGEDGTLEEKPAEYAYEISEGVWSAYSQEMRENISIYVK